MGSYNLLLEGLGSSIYHCVVLIIISIMVQNSSSLQWMALTLFLSATFIYAQDTTPDATPLNCNNKFWLPIGSVPPSNPECEEYDGSLLPDCGKYQQNNITSYYHVHEYNCSRFWECGPQGPCLFSCAPCAIDNPQCMGQEALSFDCRFQGELGPVCDWPDVVECVGSTARPTTSTTTPLPTTTVTTTTPTTTPDPGCITDDDCEDNEWCDTSGFPGVCRIGCRDDSGCTATSCSTCVDHVCHDPECCDDGDCPDVTDLICSICSANLCSRPECCVDEDCQDGYVCEDQLCVPEGECDENRPCEGANEICNIPLYDNCEWCDTDAKVCMPGCGDTANCPDGEDLTCDGEHHCTKPGLPGIINITIRTGACDGCETDPNEAGVQLYLIGAYGETECVTNGLDNLEKVDYAAGVTSFFDGSPDGDGDDDGMGGCKGFDLNLGLTGGSATWTGSGSWTAAKEAVCINFFDVLTRVKPTCCCDLANPTLASGETSDLVNCECGV